jgi:AmiR/NasT family two-component response regulator
MAAIETTGRALNNKEKSVKQYEPVAKMTERIPTLEEKKLLCQDVNFMDDKSNLRDVPFAILHAQATLAN